MCREIILHCFMAVLLLFFWCVYRLMLLADQTLSAEVKNCIIWILSLIYAVLFVQQTYSTWKLLQRCNDSNASDMNNNMQRMVRSFARFLCPFSCSRSIHESGINIEFFVCILT